jgi:hypothetical protein
LFPKGKYFETDLPRQESDFSFTPGPGQSSRKYISAQRHSISPRHRFARHPDWFFGLRSKPAAIRALGKSLSAMTPQPGRGATIGVFANFGQFVYDDINPQNPIGPFPGGLPTTDAYRSYAIRESLMSLGTP